jgi:hypothetical protein
MKLTNYILDLGRAVAYYPGLKKVTGSTTATILLCQFLYWSSKMKDSWIYKTADEIEEETGLTYNEQKTARKTLVDLKLLSEEFKRLDHTSRYKINQEELNNQWENVTGEKAETVEHIALSVPSIPSIPSAPSLPAAGTIEAEFIKPQVPQITVKRSDGEKRGDMVDGVLSAIGSPGMVKMNIKLVIKRKIEKTLHINTDSKKWEDFIEFVYGKQEREGEPIDRFLDWAIKEGFNPIYWTPEKMKTLYPQAFVDMNNMGKPRENFVEKLPEREEEKTIAPMPRDIGRQQDL